jgi:hypothetical protein
MMKDLIQLITVAGAPDAPPELRAAGVAACESLRALLSASPSDSTTIAGNPTASPNNAPDPNTALSPPAETTPLAEHVATPPTDPRTPSPTAPQSQPPAQLMLPMFAPPEALAAPLSSAPAPGAAPPTPPGFDPVAVAAIVASLRGIPADQLLDLAIMRLRAALPAEKAAAPLANSQPVRFHVVPLPPQWTNPKPGGKR